MCIAYTQSIPTYIYLRTSSAQALKKALAKFWHSPAHTTDVSVPPHWVADARAVVAAVHPLLSVPSSQS